jgi:ATP-dependent DNA helicase RecG
MQFPEWADKLLSEEMPVLRARGENQDIEYIRSFPNNTNDLAKEIAAFATSNQGTILLGVSDQGELIGIDGLEQEDKRDNYLRRIEGICRGTVKPSITPTVKFAYEDDRVIIAIFVPKGTQPVYYSGGKPYLRHITESRPAEPHEVIDAVRKWLKASNLLSEESDPYSDMISELASDLIDILIYGEESGQRECNPWLDLWRAQFANAATQLRDIAARDISVKKGISPQIKDLASILERIATLPLHTGSWAQLKEDTQKALEMARKLKQEHVDQFPLSEKSLAQIKTTIITSDRKLSDLCLRASGTDYVWRNVDDFTEQASNIGYGLLQLCYYNLNAISEGLNEKLKPIALDLHLAETTQIYVDGGNSINNLIKKVENNSSGLHRLTEAFM